MSKVVVGSIPEKICYYYSKEMEVPVGCEWDIDYFPDSKTKKLKVLPAFPADNSDTKMHATAQYWAEHVGYVHPNKNTVYTKIENNDPIKDIKVLSLEHRGQGGRAYKVLINNFYVDLREDVLMDALLQVGVLPDGILQGEYIWAKAGSQMKLVRVGSELHSIIAEYASKKDIKPVSKKELKVGEIYQTRKKTKAIFIGYVNTTKYTLPKTIRDERKRYYSLNKDKTSEFKFDKSTVKKAMLFCEISNYDTEIIPKDLSSNYYRFKILRNHSYIEKVDQIKIEEDLIEKIRSCMMKKITGQVVNFNKEKSYQLEQEIEYYSEYINLYRFGDEPKEDFDIKKYLLFI